MLSIDEAYVSLFAPLRKRTRETGVSTLEAIAAAVVSRLERVLGGTSASEVQKSLVDAMHHFVDVVLVQKRSEPIHCFDAGIIADLIRKREELSRQESRLNEHLLSVSRECMPACDRLRIVLPPVLTFCYACDCFVGTRKMPDHVLGQKHAVALKRNPMCIPSESSRGMVSWKKRRQSNDADADADAPLS
jgi:hypothetical protein